MHFNLPQNEESIDQFMAVMVNHTSVLGEKEKTNMALLLRVRSVGSNRKIKSTIIIVIIHNEHLSLVSSIRLS